MNALLYIGISRKRCIPVTRTLLFQYLRSITFIHMCWQHLRCCRYWRRPKVRPTRASSARSCENAVTNAGVPVVSLWACALRSPELLVVVKLLAILCVGNCFNHWCISLHCCYCDPCMFCFIAVCGTIDHEVFVTLNVFKPLILI